MSRFRKVLTAVLVVLLVVVVGCGVGLLALAPKEGPPMLAALPADADVVAYAEDVDALWEMLESSEGFRDFRKGPAWHALLDVSLGDALERLEKSGLRLSRSRASHLVGREVGAALWLDGSAASWLAAFRIDTFARIAEVAAGRLFMRGSVTRTEPDGAMIASLSRGALSFHWTLLGDLLLVTDSRQVLDRSLEWIHARRDDTSFAGVFQSDLEPKDGSPRAGVRLGRPDAILRALAGDVRGVGTRAPGGGRTADVLRALGLPAPLDRATISVRVDGSRVFEDTFLASPSAVSPGDRAAKHVAPPRDAFFWWSFRPDAETAADYAWSIFRKMVPPRDRGVRVSASGIDIFRQVILPRVGSDMAVALADQEVKAEGGGFPAQYYFVGVRGAGLIHAGFEQLMRSRSLGVYSAGERLPASYPYVVRHAAGSYPVYEMALRDTRRFEGFRPSVAVRAQDIVYCSSLEKLRQLKEPLDAPRRSGTATTIFPELESRGWLSAGTSASARAGADAGEVFRLEWCPPKDFRALKNAYDYVAEVRRHRGPVRKLLDDDTDYERVWRIAKDVLARVRRQSRVGFEAPGGMRMRAVWEFADGE